MDPFWIAVVSAGSAVVGAFVGALPNLLQSRAKRKERENNRAGQVEIERFDRAISFVDSITIFSGASMWHETVKLNRAASRLISTLRPGEAPVASYVRRSVDRVRSETTPAQRLAIANEVADEIFKFLRGDVTADGIGGLIH